MMGVSLASVIPLPYSLQPDPVQLFTLPNGLQVVHQYLPGTPVVVTDVWVKAGAIAEPTEWEGMAHFLEHMIFKGSHQVCPGEFDQIVETCGGLSNAATSYDYAHFYLSTTGDRLPETLPYLSDILRNATIPDAEFIRERQVVLEEISISQDDPDWLAFQALSRLLYENHPYGRSILGNAEQLCGYTPNQMRCFHRTHYQPQNLIISMVGNIQVAQALDLIQSNFSDFQVPSECPPFEVEAEPPLIEIRRNEIQVPNVEMARLIFGWLGTGVEQFNDAVGLDLLSVILAGTTSAWLVQELREKRQWVLDINSGFSLQRDSSLFTIQAWLDPEHLDDVEQVIGDRLADLQTQCVTEAELRRAKRMLCNEHIFSTESASQLAGLYGYYQTLGNLDYAHHYPQMVETFTIESLQRLVRQYLSPEHYGIVTLTGT
ncbi:M16 family metallopeptidase [Picosynechococcus sp. PCC 11901]|uniref:M16 family metallopeptidase n=1 Tax=Picosynechococcus sp. PCC 11901 TaxID=2579791 RepID=UPI0015E8C8FC|nr:pitrilysin family protein [Picosynechococcus sp. PCC 11901]